MQDIQLLQQRLGYFFKDVSLLRRALTHKSYGKLHYERLEFVGDGILDYVIALILYQSYPDLPEGDLSKIRAALVNQEVLCELALSIKLGDYLLLGDGEEKSGGRTRASILADTLEAIFAAVSFDASIGEAQQVILDLYQVKLMHAVDLIAKDSKSILQEYLQARKIDLPEYSIVEIFGPDHDTIFKVECRIEELGVDIVAQGKTKKEASQAAAFKVLSIIKRKSS